MTRLIDQCAACSRYVAPDSLIGDRCPDCADKAAQEYPIGEAYEAGWHDGHKVGLRAGRMVKAPPIVGEPGAALEPGLLRDLIRLCHPDVHPEERGGLATRVTQVLLGIRERGGA